MRSIKYLLTVIFFLLSLNFPLRVEAKDIFVDSKLSTLEYLATTYGKDSKYYIDALIHNAYENTDSTHWEYYNFFAIEIIAANQNIQKLYGISSIEYRMAMLALSNCRLYGRYLDPNYKSYSIQSLNVILSLRKLLKLSGKNQEDFLSMIASAYHDQGKNKEAVKIARQLLDLASERKNEDEHNYLNALALCIIYEVSNNNINEANSLLTLIEASPHPKAAIVMWNVANHLAQSNPSISLDCLLKTVELAGRNNSQEVLFYQVDGRTHSIWESIASRYQTLGDSAKQIDALQKARQALEDKIGRYSFEWCEATEWLCAVYHTSQADYENSAILNSELIDVYQELYGTESAALAKATENYIGNLIKAHHSEKALEYCFACANSGIFANIGYDKIYNLTAMAYVDLGWVTEAETYYQRALDISSDEDFKNTIRQNLVGISPRIESIPQFQKMFEDLPINASANEKFHLLNSIASLFKASGNESKAYEYYNRAEKDLEISAFPGRAVELYENRALVSPSRYLRILDLKKAADVYHQYMLSDSVLLGSIYVNLADSYADAMDYSNANDYYTLAAEYYQRLADGNDAKLTLLNNWAHNFANVREYEMAIRIQKLVCEIRREYLGDSHIEYSKSLSNLMAYYLDADSVPQAERIFSLYQSSREKQSGDWCADINYHNGLLQLQKQNWAEAKKSLQTALSLYDDEHTKYNIMSLLAEIARATGDTEQFVSLRRKEWMFLQKDIIENYHQLTHTERRTQQFYLQNIIDQLVENIIFVPSLTKEAFAFRLFEKGLLFHSSKEIDKILRKNAGKSEAYDRYKDLLEEKSFAHSRGDSATIIAIEPQIAMLERELTNEFVDIQKFRERLNVSLNKVLNNLGDGALGIDFVRYEIDSIAYYGAFLISKNMGSPIFMQLFSEDELRNVAFDDQNIKNSFYKDTDYRNFNLIWDKLKPYLAKSQTIYFSPDGLLNRIAIEYLRDEKRIPINEKYELHRVFHLADIKHSLTIGSAFLGIGVANHDSPQKGTTRGKWDDLSNVLPEMNNIRQTVASSPMVKNLNIIIDDDAREVKVKNMTLSKYTSLHFATHSFYLSQQELERAAGSQYSHDHYMSLRALQSGLSSFSGIAMRKGNAFRKLAELPESEDDILTTEEIEMLELDNINVCVMSSCQSGLGDIDTDGVWGLQRAFRIAGCKSLICTLDYVGDDDAELFMTTFYKEAALGKTIHESFKIAQRTLYTAHLKSPNRWNKFILIE